MIKKTFVLLIVVSVLFLPPFIKPCATMSKPVIRFGINLRYSPLAMYKQYQPLMDYLSANTPYNFELKISRDYLETLRFLKDNTTQIALLGDIAFAEARLRLGVVPILKPLNEEGRPFTSSAIFTAGNSPIKSLQDLKGRTFAFGHLHSTTGSLYPNYLLSRNGINLKDLGAYTYFKRQDDVVKAVVGGKWDAGAITVATAERYRAEGIRIIAFSEPIPTSPIVVRSDAPKELVRAVSDALLKLDRHNPAHEKIMATWDSGIRYGFTPATLWEYQQVFSIFKSIPSNCGKGCHT